MLVLCRRAGEEPNKTTIENRQGRTGGTLGHLSPAFDALLAGQPILLRGWKLSVQIIVRRKLNARDLLGLRRGSDGSRNGGQRGSGADSAFLCRGGFEGNRLMLVRTVLFAEFPDSLLLLISQVVVLFTGVMVAMDLDWFTVFPGGHASGVRGSLTSPATTTAFLALAASSGRNLATVIAAGVGGLDESGGREEDVGKVLEQSEQVVTTGDGGLCGQQNRVSDAVHEEMAKSWLQNWLIKR